MSARSPHGAQPRIRPESASHLGNRREPDPPGTPESGPAAWKSACGTGSRPNPSKARSAASCFGLRGPLFGAPPNRPPPEPRSTQNGPRTSQKIGPETTTRSPPQDRAGSESTRAPNRPRMRCIALNLADVGIQRALALRGDAPLSYKQCGLLWVEPQSNRLTRSKVVRGHPGPSMTFGQRPSPIVGRHRTMLSQMLAEVGQTSSEFGPRVSDGPKAARVGRRLPNSDRVRPKLENKRPQVWPIPGQI